MVNKKPKKIQVGGHQQRTKNNIKWAIVDAEDYDKISQYTWSLKEDKYTDYARCNDKQIDSMHRLVMKLHKGSIPKGLCVHHINGNGLDNRRANLALMTQAENLKYRRSWNKHGSKGIFFDPKTGLWKAILYIGSFKTKTEAITAHDKLDKAVKKEYLYKV